MVPGHRGLLLGGSLQASGAVGWRPFERYLVRWVFLGGGLVVPGWWCVKALKSCFQISELSAAAAFLQQL